MAPRSCLGRLVSGVGFLLLRAEKLAFHGERAGAVVLHLHGHLWVAHRWRSANVDNLVGDLAPGPDQHNSSCQLALVVEAVDSAAFA